MSLECLYGPKTALNLVMAVDVVLKMKWTICRLREKFFLNQRKDNGKKNKANRERIVYCQPY
jgi:hypothetical protein